LAPTPQIFRPSAVSANYNSTTHIVCPIPLLLFYSDYNAKYIVFIENKSVYWNWKLIFDRSTCSKRSKESLLQTFCVPFAQILEYFVMFWFQVLTCFRIISNSIILILNKFRHVSSCLDMFENCMNSNNLYHMESKQV
jgi:hypothetical protein